MNTLIRIFSSFNVEIINTMRKLSWNDIEEAADVLGTQITTSVFRPEILVGITLGGLIPLTLIAKQLKIQEVLTIHAHSYDKKEKKELIIKYPPSADLRGKKVLLIDEIADTGDTLRAISKILTEEYGAVLKTAVLVRKNSCTFATDFSAISTDEWIVFPWEKDE